MKSRCSNPSTINYPDYGGRGITVCERWRQSFAVFLADMGRRPSPMHSIDRIDNSGNYTPDNCRWATAREQSNNQRNNRHISHQGRTQTVSEWARELGLSKTTITDRIKRGWSLDAALSPIKRRRSDRRPPRDARTA